jgi:hypothetical protein
MYKLKLAMNTYYQRVSFSLYTIHYTLYTILYTLFIVLVLAACTRKTTTSPTVTSNPEEDLSKSRPKYTLASTDNTESKTVKSLPEPKADVTNKVKEKLDSIHAFNPSIVSAEGYRILIYNGSSSEESRDVRMKAFEALPDIKSYIEWRAPSFKVKVGDFTDKLEAYYVLSELQKTFPNAILVPDKVNLRSSN